MISIKTNNVFEKVDCESLDNLANILIKKGQTAEELYQRTGKRTFLHFDNVEEMLENKNSSNYKILKEFIDNSEQRHHVISVFNGTKMKDVPAFDNILKLKTFSKSDVLLQNSLDLMTKRMEQNDFSHIDAEYFKRRFTHLLALERAGRKGATEKITNGILLQGPDGATKITAEAIKNTVDANWVKIEYNSKRPMSVIEGLVDNSEKAKEVFQKTGKRTIIEIDKIDELLTNHENNLANRKLIARFKGFVEHMSKDYFATMLVKTSKSLDDFEEASIGPNRFGLKFRMDKN